MRSIQRGLSIVVVFYMIAWTGGAAVGNACYAAEPPTPADRPVDERRALLVTLDGVRREDVFNGFDPRLNLLQAGGVQKPAELARRFHRDTPQASRAELMPFPWQVVATGVRCTAIAR